MVGDISASASNSSASGTGGVQFGNVTIGAGIGGSSSAGGFPTWAYWLIGAAAAFLLWKFFGKKKR